MIDVDVDERDDVPSPWDAPMPAPEFVPVIHVDHEWRKPVSTGDPSIDEASDRAEARELGGDR